MSNRILWHYTIGAYIEGILLDGHLKLTSVRIEDGERPALWFSYDPIMEPTACKGRPVPGGYQTMTMQETHDTCGGLYRLSLNPSVTTHNFTEYKTLSGISEEGYAHLVAKGKTLRANPKDWRVVFEPVSLTDIDEIQQWNGFLWKRFAGK